METLAVLAVVGSFKYLAASWIRLKIKQRFRYFGTVSRINLYPVKGCHATRVNSAKCGPLGLEVNGVKDRCIMVVDTEAGIGQFLRHYPKMTYIDITVGREEMVLDAPDMESLKLQRTPDTNQAKVICQVHECKQLTRDFGDKAADWIGRYLGNDKLRLVYYMENTERRTIETDKLNRGGNPNISPEDKISFTVASSYLLTNERTLEELSKVVTEPVKMDNFRPNIVINGLSPFEEDKWSQIRIGENVIFRCQESCRRCAITTINPDTAERSKKNEPLKTLKTYKEKVGGVPTSFGVYAAAESGGEIKVGDQVYVLN